MCTEAEKVVLAVYQLKRIASTWWRATRGTVFPEGVVQEWNAFVEVFNNKYFFDSAREMKMAEFQCLCQGAITVNQYEAKFAELSQYAPVLVENPVNRARRFKDGLRSDVKSLLVPFNLKDYNDLYERALLIERDKDERATASGSRFGSNRDGNRFEKRPMAGGRYPIPPIKKGGIGKSSNQNGVCCACERRHGSAPCPVRTGACYVCGQQGHLARNCPRRQMGPPQLSPSPQMGQNRGLLLPNEHQGGLLRPPAQGRTYAITRG
ncbi:hypothetical protein ACJRO7_016560 [Eucalyptus globulus]|uniref:CCHC-type domain-containing protein n=1 Tax=Eucalyptus globulus TaxID=34317 RepID=A0ABD3L7D8_EUCGL